MSRFLLKRDDTSINAPAPEQLAVGELVINSVTGKLYSKITSGEIIEYIGKKVCSVAVPEVSFIYESNTFNDLINDFCCAGAIFSVVVDKLQLEPANYSFSLVELTNNTTTEKIILNDPEYSIYTENDTEYRSATIPVNLSINASAYTNISLFKFNVFLDSVKILETLVTIQCLEANR